ncbi:MAG: M48 family metalloprotease [Pikeienuella sp.]
MPLFNRTRASFTRLPLAMLAAFSLVACAPAGGPDRAPTTVGQRSVSDQRLGDQEHPKILAQFGGEVSNRELRNYVRTLGKKLAANSEQPEGPWTFTVLDSPVVNAFALPGGYVYVTRGLVALANDEAELAGVIGHEIGHVTGAHTAQRQERAGIAQLGVLGATILGAVAGLDGQSLKAINQAGSAIGQGYVANFSRGQEFQADSLGIRYLARAGYDPLAQADFLASLQAQAELQSQIAGRQFDPNRVDFFSTHPATPQRVREAIATAKSQGVAIAEDAPRNQGRFLRVIDGMTYGDSAEQGFVRDGKFIHPKLRFAFTAPEGFRITNAAQNVVAAGEGGAGLIFDGARDPGGDLRRYIQNDWAAGIAKQTRVGRLTDLRNLRIDGLQAAQAQMPVATNQGTKLAHFTVIRRDGQLYRFLGLEPQNARGVGAALNRSARSFDSLTPGQARRYRPYSIDVYTVRRGDTVARLARKMPFDDFNEERFRVLNSLAAGEELRRGQKVKIIRE